MEMNGRRIEKVMVRKLEIRMKMVVRMIEFVAKFRRKFNNNFYYRGFSPSQDDSRHFKMFQDYF